MIINGKFTPAKIDETVREAEQFAQQAGLKNKSCLKFRISLEEIFLIYQEAFSPDTDYRLEIKKKSGDIRVILTVTGDKRNPLDDRTLILDRALQDFDGVPEWSFSDGKNRLEYRLPLYNTLRKNIQMSWKYMAGQRKTFVLAVTSQLISVGLNIVAPVLSAQIIVNLEQNLFRQILLTALALLAVRGINNFVLFVANRSYNIVYNKTLTNLESDLVHGVLHISNHCIDEKGAGLFIQRMTSDTSALATGFNTLADQVTQICNYIGILIAILVVNPLIFGVVIILLTVQSVLEIIRTRKMKADDRSYREANERFTGFVGEMVKGAKDVKLLDSEKNFESELTHRITEANDKRMYMQGHSWKYRLTRMEIGETGFFAFVMLLAVLIANSTIEPVTAIVLFNYYSNLGAPAVLLIGQFLEFIKDLNLSAERVYALLNSPEFPKEKFGSTHLERMSGAITFEHVCFAYKNQDPQSEPGLILNDMNFDIPAGISAAFVGKSGCGKTTTFNLISKLYEASGGVVSLDGVNIKDLDRETIRSNIAVVSQNPYIFHLSVRDNLRLVKPDLTEEEMHRVCAMACIDEDIERMTEGYDTVLGEGGNNLSGGQRQRLAIARALLKDFRILLLDEATSALDNITQSRIQKAIYNVQKGHTVVMIAHRLSSIRDADRIFYMESGKILAEGTHPELMQSCSPYRELYEQENA